MPSKGRTRIPLRIGRDDVGVDVDDWEVVVHGPQIVGGRRCVMQRKPASKPPQQTCRSCQQKLEDCQKRTGCTPMTAFFNPACPRCQCSYPEKCDHAEYAGS